MKTTIALLAGTILSFYVMSQDPKVIQKQEPNPNSEKYCSELRDSGVIVIVRAGKEVTEEVLLANGVTLKLNGVVAKKDGTSFILKNGECIDTLGNLIQAMGRIENIEQK
jgi:predicted mannosyl-3-phosphoglycerate phosphatase (HAD superfamily)